MSLEEEFLVKDKDIKTGFQINQDKLQHTLEEIKTFNDHQQSVNITSLTNSDIQTSRKQFKQKAEKAKDFLTQLEKTARGNEQKNIVSKLKQLYTKEVERQKRIMKSFVNTSFEQKFSKISVIRQSKALGVETQQEQLKYFVDQNYVKVVPKELRDSITTLGKSKVQPYSETAQRVKTVSTDEDFIERDMIDLENMLIDERQQELDQIEKEALQLNLMANEMGGIVDQQGQQLYIGQDNLNTAKANVIAASNELVKADSEQQKTRKLIYYGVGVIIVLLLVVMIVILVK